MVVSWDPCIRKAAKRFGYDQVGEESGSTSGCVVVVFLKTNSPPWPRYVSKAFLCSKKSHTSSSISSVCVAPCLVQRERFSWFRLLYCCRCLIRRVQVTLKSENEEGKRNDVDRYQKSLSSCVRYSGCLLLLTSSCGVQISRQCGDVVQPSTLAATTTHGGSFSSTHGKQEWKGTPA